MKKASFLFFLPAIITGQTLTQEPGPKEKIIAFGENKGQVYDQNDKPRPDVMFGTSDGKLTFHIRRSGVSYQVSKTISPAVMDLQNLGTTRHIEDLKSEQQTIARVDLDWMGSNPDFKVVTGNALEGYSNFYNAVAPRGVLNVKSYTDVTLQNIYKGIDVKYFSKEGHIKYDYVVAPYADYRQIRLRVSGALSIKKNSDGSLSMTTSVGEIREEAPYVLQGGKVLIAKWILGKDNSLSFEIEGADPSMELLIDPVVRIWGTYYGGNTDEQIFSSAALGTNAIYVCGYIGASGNSSVLATSNGYQTTRSGGEEAFLGRFTSTGSLQWGTYYGGPGVDWAHGVAVGASGDVYLAGTTANSGSIIATPGSHQSAESSTGNYEAFLVKFNGAGQRQWATLYGGSGAETGNSCSSDGTGNVILAGYTTSNGTGTTIASSGAHQTSHGGGTDDAFVVKFNSSGVRQWGTYYGGDGNQNAYKCMLAPTGEVYVSGFTSSITTGALSSNGAFQANYSGGNNDLFIAKFSSSGARQWGTLYGGTLHENFGTCNLDGSGNVYLAGTTSSTGTILATAGAYQTTNAGGYDGLIAKFSPSGNRIWSTYFGGPSDDGIKGSTIGFSGELLVCGYTNSGSGISTSGAHQTVHGGNSDAFVSAFSTSGSIFWSTYYGDSYSEMANTVSSVWPEDLYLAGTGSMPFNTTSSLTTSGSYQSTFGGGLTDGFLTRFQSCVPIDLEISVPSTICAGATASFIAYPTHSLTFVWVNWSGPNSSNINYTIPNIQLSDAGVYTLVAVSNCSYTETYTFQVNVVSAGSVTISQTPSIVCEGDPVVLTASGATSYTWQGNVHTNTLLVHPMAGNSYSVVASLGSSCTVTSGISIPVSPIPTVSILSFPHKICVGDSAMLNAGGAINFSWINGPQGALYVVSPTVTTTYTVHGSGTGGCSDDATITLTVEDCTGIGELTKPGIEVFPNPANDFVVVKVHASQVCRVELHSASGALVRVATTSDGSANLQVKDLAVGVYFLRIHSGPVPYSVRILKN